MKKISDLPEADRPRERLLLLGAGALSDQELLALLVGSGGKDGSVFNLAAEILAVIDDKNGNLKAQDILQVKGVGAAKACAISAALEFARRRISPDGVRIREAKDAIPLIQHLVDRKQETFLCISLNGANEVIASRVVTVGIANACQVHPREVLAEPITDRACSIIVAHNHPSGDPTPSDEDRRITERLKAAASVLGINFLDHIIFAKRGYYSLQEGRVIAY